MTGWEEQRCDIHVMAGSTGESHRGHIAFIDTVGEMAYNTLDLGSTMGTFV